MDTFDPMNLIDIATEMPKESKRERAKAKTRHALLKSALQLYSAEGACGMSMNKIAKMPVLHSPAFIIISIAWSRYKTS